MTSPEPLGYRVARRTAVDGPWIADWNDILYATREEAEAEALEAERVRGFPWEVWTVYPEGTPPGPVIPPQDV